jgi:ABC-type multidrug transport system permease subunit
MLIVIGSGLSFVGLLTVIISGYFIKKEGEDERGDKIMGIAGKIAYFAFLLGFSIIFVINNMKLLKNSLQFNFALTCLLALVVISYTATIMVLKKRY